MKQQVIYHKKSGAATAENYSIRKESGFDGMFDLGQKNISSILRWLLNPDEIIRLSFDKLFGITRGNKPYLLDKLIYTKHPLAKEIKETPIESYIPEYKRNKELETTQIKVDDKTINEVEKKESTGSTKKIVQVPVISEDGLGDF